MKFKRVEISAFRIYDRPEDATFDFTLPSGIADFVAIYAPNGFGKTSFYDAIEWGVTNNILRFWQDKDLTEKSILALKDISDDQIKLWRNNTSNLETSVKIYTDSQTTFNRILKPHGNSDADITRFNDVERKDFRQVILSQEWISAFLKEINGERRYEIFMENPDLKDLNSYYTNLKSILDQAAENAQTLRATITEKQLEIISTTDTNILQTINNHISILNQTSNTSLPPLSINSTQENVIDFKNTISAKSIEVDRKIASTQEKIDSIGIAHSGLANIPSLQQYLESNKMIPNLKSELDVTIKNIGNHDAFNTLSGKDISQKNLLRSKNSEQEFLNQIALDFETFAEIRSSITDLQSRISAKEKESTELITSYEGLIGQSNSIRTRRDNILRQINELEARLKAVPNLSQELEETTKKVESNTQTQREYVEVLNNDRLVYTAIQNEIERFEQIVEDLEDASQHDVGVQSDQIAKQYQALIDSKVATSEITRSIGELDLKIEEQQSLNDDIQDFIRSGHEIVNRSQSTSCPLCTHEYSSFSELASKIAGNNALKSSLQVLLQQKNALTESLVEQKRISEAMLTTVRSHYEEILAKLKERLAAAQGRIEKTERLSNLNNEALISLENRIQEIQIEFDGLSPIHHEEKLSKTLKSLTDQRDIHSTNLLKIEKSITDNAELSKIAKDTIELLTGQLTSRRRDSKYVNVNNWLKENHAGQNPTVDFINEKLKLLRKEIDDLSTSITELEKEIEKARLNLTNLTDTELRINHDRLRSQIDTQKSISMSFEYFMLDKLESKVDPEHVEAILAKLESSLRASIEADKRLQADYQTLERFSDNVMPYLKSESTKLEIASLESELRLMSINVIPAIDQERRSTKEYLEKKVQDFFFTKLINKIYNKIDPHPEYKCVEFKVDFDADVPRLDIFVVNDQSEGKLIPNLYFSTAQINILSMSIFLASALNSPTYKSIFIDDPIQSMDSINVLSTIDLIRSMVVNEQRQIILSTHDNNFYNLLKKKIPYPQYKSRFIELETFGKVKADS